MTASNSVSIGTRRYTRTSSLRRPDGQKPSGYVLHQDADRVVIVTGVDSDSTNTKTGGLLQVWVLVAKCNPLEAIRRMFDRLVCGFCRHRGTYDKKLKRMTKRTCYVRMDTAPLAVWSGWRRGIYPYLPKSRYADVFVGRTTRWGAYGDPYFIPRDIIRYASFLSDAHTGYTHQWTQWDAQDLRTEVMASVDTEAEFLQAQSMGWRTFRVRTAAEPIQPNEIVCPASIEATEARVARATAALGGCEGPVPACRVTCADCTLCDGAREGTRKSIVINAHGASKAAFTLIQIAA